MGAIPSGADPTGWSALTGANPQAGYDAGALEGSLVAGGISALAGRTQIAVMNAKAAEISVNALWKALSDAFFAGLTPDGIAHLPVLLLRAIGAALGIDVTGWVELVDATAGFASFILNLPAEVAAQVQALIDYLFCAFTGVSGVTGKTALELFTVLEAFYLGAVTVISDLGTLLNILFDMLTGGIGSTGKTLADVLTAGNAFYAAVAAVISGLGALLNGLFDMFTGVSGATGKTLADVKTVISAWYTLVNGVGSGFQTLLNNLHDIFTGGLGATGKTVADVLSAGQTFFTGAAGAATKVAALITGVGGATIADVVSVLSHLNATGLYDAAFLTGTLAATILTQIANAIIALFPNKFGGLPTGLTGLGDLLTDVIGSLGIASSLGSGSPVLNTLAADIPVLVPAIEIIQGAADGLGLAAQGATAFVQTVVTDGNAAAAAFQAQLQAVIPFVIPHFW